MKTICIQIGNTDNKLTQQEWFEYVTRCIKEIKYYTKEQHYFGGSATWEKWQNVCWVIRLPEEPKEHLKRNLKEIKKQFNQDSIAWLEGETQFI